jgi:hypothetical protein
MSGTKSCVVLDLDATLINTFGTIHNWRFADLDNIRANNRIFDIKTEGSFLWGTKRPGVEQFLKACFKHFDVVGVWSAGAHDYVHKIVEILFPARPDFIWTRDDCVDTMQDEEKIDTVRQKPLEKLFRSFPEINPKKILIFDDYLDVCGQNTMYHVHVPAWRFDFESITATDLTMTKLAKWVATLETFHDYKFASPKSALC